MLASAPGARYLHFATHGLLDARTPLDSALVLSVEGGDDGLLRAWEVRDRLRLDADLVTLSACQSALGQEAVAEGLVGLTRAFQRAGARSVLASLWAVTDRPTARFMESFYVRVRDGDGPRPGASRRPRSRAWARASTPTTGPPSSWRATGADRGNMAGRRGAREAAYEQQMGDQGMLRRFAFAAVIAAALTSSARARTTPPETVDLVVVSRIRDEGFARSQGHGHGRRSSPTSSAPA